MSETAHLCGYPGGGGEGRSHSREVCVEVSATNAFEMANPVEDKNCSVCYPVLDERLYFMTMTRFVLHTEVGNFMELNFLEKIIF